MKKHSKFLVRAFSFLLAAVLLFGPMTLGMEAHAADKVIETGTTTASYLFVRSGAGSNYARVTGLWKGSPVDILEEKDGWYRIDIGWISADHVKLDKAASTTPTPSTTPAPSAKPTPSAKPETVIKTGTTTASYLFVRSGAGSNYARVTGLWKGSPVDILEEKDGWYRIDTGWISADHVKLDGGSSTTVTTPTPTPSTDSTVSTSSNATVTASLLYIRKDPSTNYSAIGMLRKGDRIHVSETNGNWAKTEYGWVFSEYVAMDNGSSLYNKKLNAVVTANELNVREAPSYTAKVVGTMRVNQRVEVLGTSGEWLNTNYGWIHRNFIKIVDSTSANNTGTVRALALNVRQGPGIGYARVGTVRLGEKVTILENQGEWLRIKSGWVNADYIKIGG